MNEDRRYHLLFDEFMRATNDGFIVVDKEGIVTDINEKYCIFLGKKHDEIIGRPIRDIISTTKMYDVLKAHSRGDGPAGVYLHHYGINDNQNNVDTFAVGNRFCFFGDDGEVLGAAAQVSFKERVAAMGYYLIEQELNYLKTGELDSDPDHEAFDRIMGTSQQMQALKEKARKIAKRDFSVLITGETGTGKELFAKALHMESNRRDKPLISINCAAIPPDLLESELFGYEGGAFTGARKGGKLGKFELADGGTIFLDEIGDMALPLQAKLLRVLQEREIERVGGGMPIPIDVRIISATRRDLQKMVSEGSFREDLFYRLSVINLETIPLRDRREDILLYATNTLNQLNQQYKTEVMMSDGVKRRLQEYSWPGNVRELINVITSAYASCDVLMIDETDLPLKYIMHSSGSGSAQKRLSERMDDYEATLIRDALRRNNQNCRQAAEELGIERSLMYKKMRRLGISIQKVLGDKE